jgi:mono/diheme cytochrome c family protein
MNFLIFLLLNQAHGMEQPTLFKDNCVVCHGPQGHGDGPAASAMNPRPRNLATDPFKNGDSVEQIEGTLKSGLNQMPSFSWLSDADRETLANYIKSLRK